jgi:hypothetical protein
MDITKKQKLLHTQVKRVEFESFIEYSNIRIITVEIFKKLSLLNLGLEYCLSLNQNV